jgi:hypothetical protein
MTAPVASGWSVRRVGLAPTGKRRLLTAHANSGRSPTEMRTSQITEAGARDGTEIKIYLGLLHWNPPRVVSMIAAVIALLPLEDVAARDPARRVRTHGWQDGPSFEINGFVIKKERSRPGVKSLIDVKSASCAISEPFVRDLNFRKETGSTAIPREPVRD